MLHILTISQCSSCIKYPFHKGKQQLIVLITDLYLPESTGQVLSLDRCVNDFLHHLLQGLQEVVRIILDASPILCTHIDSELPWFHPVPIEVDLDLVLAIIDDWKEKHVDEVLEP